MTSCILDGVLAICVVRCRQKRRRFRDAGCVSLRDQLHRVCLQGDNVVVSDPRFHVFLEGAVDNTRDGVEELASAIANRYGLSQSDLKARLFQGKVRVKANVDRATADQFARDLAGLGGITSVAAVDAAADAANNAARPSTSGLAAAASNAKSASKPVGGGFQSGLAAAFSATPATAEAPVSFGALEGDAISLSSLDGSNAAIATPTPQFGPPGDEDGLTLREDAPAPSLAHITPRIVAPTASSDRFAPPSETGAAAEVTLADDLEPRMARATSLAERSVASANAAAVAAEVVNAKPKLTLREHFANWRVRLAVGVFVAIIVGLLPAMLVHSMRESSAFADIDRNVARLHAQAETYEAWQSLDPMRATQLERKRSARKNAAEIAMVVWAIAGAGVAYVWFRRVPWDRVVGDTQHA